MNTKLITCSQFFALVVTITTAFAECEEYQIIDNGDSVEAVCVGKPLTAEEQKIKLEEEKRDQQKALEARNAERKAENERIAAESRALELKAQEAKKNAAKTADKLPEKQNSRLDKARQQLIR